MAVMSIVKTSLELTRLVEIRALQTAVLLTVIFHKGLERNRQRRDEQKVPRCVSVRVMEMLDGAIFSGVH